jgi:hypothetical protein
MTAARWLSAVAGVSLVYDLSAGLLLFIAPATVASWFGARVPDPILFVRLTALFLVAVGLGYIQPLRHPQAHRAYLWVFGPVLKGLGAAVFVVDYLGGGSPASFLLFAVTDGTLALATLAALALPSDDRARLAKTK